MNWEDMELFGATLSPKWFVTYEIYGVTYYLASSDEHARELIWSQQQNKALKFDSSNDAEKVMVLIKSRRNNKKLVFKVK